VSLPSAPPGNVTVTVTPSSGIKATPATLAFAPTVFSGTVTVESTATPGTTGTVKFSAPGYADGVVNVTVDQSTNLVVKPASLKIPANGAESFTVKLAKAPTAPVTVTVTPSTSALTTTPAFPLTFTAANFDTDQTVLVSTGPGAVPGAQSVLLDAGKLGKFNLPVTITPTSNTIFFINPTDGNDAFPGTAAQPWQTVENALNITQLSGSKVALAASLGNDVVVTILGGTNITQNVGASINTPALSVGSVTVLQAPFPKTFTLNMAGSQLTLNKGYKLQDIKIKSSATVTAVLIKHPTAGLASVDVNCTGTGVICVKVEGLGAYTLKDVTVDVTANTGNIGIQNDANANLSIIGGEVKLTGTTDKVILIESNGLLIATDLTVDMTGGVTGGITTHTKNSTGIVLNAPGSSVTNSTIKVNKCTITPGTQYSIGIDVQHTTGKSTVVGNNFIGYGTTNDCPAIGVKGSTQLSPAPSPPNNNFSGAFGNPVQ